MNYFPTNYNKNNQNKSSYNKQTYIDNVGTFSIISDQNKILVKQVKNY